MVITDEIQVGRCGICLQLLDRLGAGDHAADGRVPQAPAKAHWAMVIPSGTLVRRSSSTSSSLRWTSAGS